MFFSKDIQSISFWTIGDDWLGFQYFARQIIFENEWLRAGEGAFYFRPGIRYVIAVMHILFGDSGFSFKMLDVWAIIGMSLILFSLFNKTNISPILSLIAIFILITIFLVKTIDT